MAMALVLTLSFRVVSNTTSDFSGRCDDPLRLTRITMVLLMDLEEEGSEECIAEQYRRQLQQKGQPYAHDIPSEVIIEGERQNPNLGGFSRALAAWPVVSAIAQHLDLNTLHNLSATCRQFRVELSQYRSQLVRQTLTCVNDEEYRMKKFDEGSKRRNDTRGFNGRLTSGRISRCARDLVGECRRCGIVVCRVHSLHQAAVLQS
jgi:hypothetical protein